MPAQDDVNRSTFSRPDVLGEIDTPAAELAAWSDPGEQAAISAVAPDAHGVPILDLGVGAGRTTTLLRLLSHDYVGIDYTPELVRAARRRHPGVDIRQGDARDLSDIADASIGLVVFCYNGLDAVSHDDRAVVLREIARVLRPGGLFQFSTLNKDGPCLRATPWRPAGSQLAPGWTPAYRAAMGTLRVLRAPVALPRQLRNRARLLGSAVDGDDWALAPLEAFDFGLLVHYRTLAGVRAELGAAGLALERCFDAEHGRPVADAADVSGVRYFQLVARRC